MQVTTKTRLAYRAQHLIFVLLLLACIAFAGWLSNEYVIRSDWTAGKRHSLSNDTIQLLKQLPEPVTLRSYQPDDAVLTQAITEILQRYQDNHKAFSFQIINPDIFIQQAKADHITRYGQSVIEYRGLSESIEKLTEENISNALLRLQRGDKPDLLFVSQHGERSISERSATGYSQLAERLTNNGFNVQSINLLQQPLSADVLNSRKTLLILAAINKPLLATEQQKLQQYIQAGGNLLWLQDPALDDSQQVIADALNIDFINGVVVDNNQEVSLMLKLSHPAMIPVLEYKLHPITKNMKYFTLFTTAAAIRSYEPKAESSEGAETHPWIHSELLISSETSWSETDDFASEPEFNQGKDTRGPLSIGIALQKQIKTDNILTSQRAVVIGDTDFLANNNLGQGANLDFILQVINWLVEDDNLIAIAPKSAPDLKLNLSSSMASVMGIFFLLILPLVLFSTGTFIWLKRRKQ